MCVLFSKKLVQSLRCLLKSCKELRCYIQHKQHLVRLCHHLDLNLRRFCLFPTERKAELCHHIWSNTLHLNSRKHLVPKFRRHQKSWCHHSRLYTSQSKYSLFVLHMPWLAQEQLKSYNCHEYRKHIYFLHYCLQSRHFLR